MFRRATAALLLGSVLGCTSVQQMRPADTPVPSERLAILWVTNEYHEVIPVGQPRLAGDSLVGTWVGVGEPVAIPLEDGTAVRKFDPKRTALVGLGLTAGTVLLLMMNGGSGDAAGDMDNMCTGDMGMMDMGECM